jgi:hypothetical protein
VRIHSATKIREDHTSAEARADRALASWRDSRSRSTRVEPIDVGEKGYAATDEMTIQIPLYRTVIYDLHAKFRISNALVDVSARTHRKPDAKAMALVVELAKNIAGRLTRTG